MGGEQLRIGNLGQYAFDRKFFVLDSVQKREGFFEPIELTEDILYELGWYLEEYLDPEDYPEDEYKYIIVGDYIFPIYRPRGNMNDFYFKSEAGITEIKYVHELQNIFYALTKSEIDITPLLFSKK